MALVILVLEVENLSSLLSVLLGSLLLSVVERLCLDIEEVSDMSDDFDIDDLSMGKKDRVCDFASPPGCGL